MTVELDKQDLIALVRGTEPSYEQMEHPLVRIHGRYVGGFVDRWEWNISSLEELSEKLLWQIYQYCKRQN